MIQTAEVLINKLVHGGQGIGVLEDGRKIFVWNVLPGERVVVEVRKHKNKYLEGIAVEIIQASEDRITPRDDAYLSTSPWQMMTFEAENRYKRDILIETFQREHVELTKSTTFFAGKKQWHYRNKMEYSFWGDDDGLHLALFNRASHGKRIISGSSIAMTAIDEVACKILGILNENSVRASQLKTVVIRCDQRGNAVVGLFVKDENFPDIPALANVCSGLAVYYSNPKSPASIITKTLVQYGDITLTDSVHGKNISYDVNSFFQVNLEIFNRTLLSIEQKIDSTKPCIDMYSGVGTIGLSVGLGNVLVDIDRHNCEMARMNSQGSAEVIEAPAEKAVEYIDNEHPLIVDPPRAGLHADVTARIREVLPPQVIYLSCNPITQARDLALLQDVYSIGSLEGYNFFPRTPHIESLVVLERKL